MSILSFEFIACFAGVTLVFYLLPIKYRWAALLAASLAFYALSGWQGMVYLLCVALVTWGAALIMGHLNARIEAAMADENPALTRRLTKRKRRELALTLILCFGALIVIKYIDAGRAALNTLLGAVGAREMGAFTIFIPLGLSYFTFQSAGYVLDSYWAKYPPEKNPLKYLLFVSFFPQMTQGPISSYPELSAQLYSPAPFAPRRFTEGFQLAVWGYFKKLVLADRLAPVTVAIAAGEGQPGYIVVMGVILYAIRLYADFSGGMDVVCGAAKMLGVELTPNFRRPFFSLSVAEYWRRWHITLGAWFRKYLYYPLVASRFGAALGRVGKRAFGRRAGRMLPAAFSTLIIFLCIGVWHTANVNAVLYGVYFGVIMGASLLMEGFFKSARKKLRMDNTKRAWQAARLMRTLLIVLIAQLFALTDSPRAALALFSGAFARWDFSLFIPAVTALLKPLEWLIAGAAAMLLLIVDLLNERGWEMNRRLAGGTFILRWIVLIALIAATLIFGCYGNGFDGSAFLYTRF